MGLSDDDLGQRIFGLSVWFWVTGVTRCPLVGARSHTLVLWLFK